MLLAAGMSAVGGKADISRSCAAVVSKRWPVSTVVCQSGDPRTCATNGSHSTAKAKVPQSHISIADRLALANGVKTQNPTLSRT
jgi:hypothetical protein